MTAAVPDPRGVCADCARINGGVCCVPENCAAVPDPREPKPCPRCGETCTHDGWGHVHPNGIGIGSCAVPDPRFRDQLAKWIHEKTRNPSGSVWGWWSNELTEAADELLALIAAEVEARVQAAANQRAAEELEAAARGVMAGATEVAGLPVAVRQALTIAATTLSARAAALASPAPAPHAEEGQ